MPRYRGWDIGPGRRILTLCLFVFDYVNSKGNDNLGLLSAVTK